MAQLWSAWAFLGRERGETVSKTSPSKMCESCTCSSGQYCLYCSSNDETVADGSEIDDFDKTSVESEEDNDWESTAESDFPLGKCATNATTQRHDSTKVVWPSLRAPLVRPWRTWFTVNTMRTVVEPATTNRHVENGPTATSIRSTLSSQNPHRRYLYKVDDPTAISQSLATRVLRKVMALFVVTNEPSGGGSSSTKQHVYHFGQAGIVRYSRRRQRLQPFSEQKQRRQYRPAAQRQRTLGKPMISKPSNDIVSSVDVPTEVLVSTRLPLASAPMGPFTGRVVTSSRHLSLRQKAVHATTATGHRNRQCAAVVQSAILIRPNAISPHEMYAFPGIPLPTDTTLRPAPDAPPEQQRGRGAHFYSTACSQSCDITYSAVKVFNEATTAAAVATTDAAAEPLADCRNSSHGIIRPFVAVRADFRYAVGQCVGMAIFPYESHPSVGALLKRLNVAPAATSSVMPADLHNPHANQRMVHICTGKITYVGEHHIEYDIHTLHLGGASVGAMVFLLDQRQPRTTVQERDYGRAVAIHTGYSSVSRTNFGVMLQA